MSGYDVLNMLYGGKFIICYVVNNKIEESCYHTKKQADDAIENMWLKYRTRAWHKH